MGDETWDDFELFVMRLRAAGARRRAELAAVPSAPPVPGRLTCSTLSPELCTELDALAEAMFGIRRRGRAQTAEQSRRLSAVVRG